MEDQFFCLLHLGMAPWEAMEYPVHERKWMVARFIQHKEQEADAIERARRKAKVK